MIEFLERTTNRNLKHAIDYMVKQRMRECAEDLNRRREELRSMLQWERLRCDEELALWAEARAAEAEQKHREWVDLERVKREQAEQELLALKNQQREIENCESMRELQSKQIVRETKEAQLYQIEERKALASKQQQIDLLWLTVHQRLAAVREQQELYEQKLRKLIADNMQTENLSKVAEERKRQAQQMLVLRQNYTAEEELLREFDARTQEQQQAHLRCKRLQQSDTLKQQIVAKETERLKQEKSALAEDMQSLLKSNEQIRRERMQQDAAQLNNRIWHKKYLEQTQLQRAADEARDKHLQLLYVGTGCVLQQTNKKPYNKNVR